MLANQLLQAFAWRPVGRCAAFAFIAGAALVVASPLSAAAQNRDGALTAAEAANIPELQSNPVEAQRLRDTVAAARAQETASQFRANADTAQVPGAREEQLRQALFDHASDAGDLGVAPER